MRNEVQLIAYADRLGGSLPGLRELLDGPLRGLFGGVHVLPFFRPFDGADAGFDPEDHTEVDPRLGTWDDVAAIGAERDLVVDVIVNHVSTGSPQFRDLLARGDRSPHAGMFLTLGTVFPGGASEEDLLRIFRPRPGLPFTQVALEDGTRRLLWTTFTSAQADIDVTQPATREYLRSVLGRLAAAGTALVRLDAVGYAVKTPGTSCFMTPETFAFIDELSAEARAHGLEVLVEVHSHFERQLAIAARVNRVYDFALPPLVLHGLHTGDAEPLRHWLRIRPANAVTVLDTHDGIGVVDVGADGHRPGLLEPAKISALVDAIHAASGGTSLEATGAAASNVDLYQVNCTYYDALGRDDARMVLARALQLFTPGIPQAYYVGFLGGTNDVDLLRRTGVGRDINRHHYTPDEVAAALERPVVRRQAALIGFRNAHPAFAGEPDPPGGEGSEIVLGWRAGDQRAQLRADLATATLQIAFTDADGRERTVAELEALPA